MLAASGGDLRDLDIIKWQVGKRRFDACFLLVWWREEEEEDGRRRRRRKRRSRGLGV